MNWRLLKFLLPLLAFLGVVIFLGIGLQRDPREVPSPLIGKAAPAFRAAVLGNPSQSLSGESLRGQVWILNVWASWCGACIEEHPVMLRLASATTVPIYGLDYKDRDVQALAWLDRRGNPYRATLLDPQGRIGLDFGVYGVPETFVIDKAGKVRFKQIGPVTDDVLERSIRPLLEQLNRE